ncbi:MAG: hypothetical protein FJ276_34085, partial [Planctomycetes bacterium]|nr:hypothetical protein [Planctomycetota bacterium]
MLGLAGWGAWSYVDTEKRLYAEAQSVLLSLASASSEAPVLRLMEIQSTYSTWFRHYQPQRTAEIATRAGESDAYMALRRMVTTSSSAPAAKLDAIREFIRIHPSYPLNSILQTNDIPRWTFETAITTALAEPDRDLRFQRIALLADRWRTHYPRRIAEVMREQCVQTRLLTKPVQEFIDNPTERQDLASLETNQVLMASITNQVASLQIPSADPNDPASARACRDAVQERDDILSHLNGLLKELKRLDADKRDDLRLAATTNALEMARRCLQSDRLPDAALALTALPVPDRHPSVTGRVVSLEIAVNALSKADAEIKAGEFDLAATHLQVAANHADPALTQIVARLHADLGRGRRQLLFQERLSGLQQSWGSLSNTYSNAGADRALFEQYAANGWRDIQSTYLSIETAIGQIASAGGDLDDRAFRATTNRMASLPPDMTRLTASITTLHASVKSSQEGAIKLEVQEHRLSDLLQQMEQRSVACETNRQAASAMSRVQVRNDLDRYAGQQSKPLIQAFDALQERLSQMQEKRQELRTMADTASTARTNAAQVAGICIDVNAVLDEFKGLCDDLDRFNADAAEVLLEVQNNQTREENA